MPDHIVNEADAEELTHLHGRWGAHYKVLTPRSRQPDGGIGLNVMRVPPGCSGVPFHWHLREDELFYVLRGRGVLRYGEQLDEIGPGDCISCPAGTRVAHQIANPFEEELVYLAVGKHDPDEVCGYPDSGKILVRGVGKVGLLDEKPYMHGEPEVPTIFGLVEG
jgi:uncharacterized cupin superfamily protein